MIDIRQATVDDAPILARLHVEAFPGFFLTSLGEGFLRQLYRGFCSSPDAICLVAGDGPRIVGVVAGPVRPKEFFRGLLVKRGLSFALAAVPGLVRNPVPVGRRLLSALTYRGEAPATHASAALVSTICVAPAGRGSGAAVRLLEEFCAAAAKRGASYVYLTTDRDQNERVNSFYERAGFVLESEIHRDGGRVMNRYIKHLDHHAD